MYMYMYVYVLTKNEVMCKIHVYRNRFSYIQYNDK